MYYSETFQGIQPIFACMCYVVCVDTDTVNS